MLQRVLAGLCRLEGVSQAMLIDDSGQLLASVGDEGVMPPFEDAVEMIQVAQETGDALGNDNEGTVDGVQDDHRCGSSKSNCRFEWRWRAISPMAPCP